MWQVVYEELKDQGLEIIAVAFDTGGKAAVEAGIRAADCRQRPEMVARLMGWSADLWARQAPPTYPCLIDENHLLAELYGMVNVPQAVWIDERGRIVRPAESAGTSDVVRQLNRETLEIPDAAANVAIAARSAYIDALRDWVRHGDHSRYVLSPAEIRRRMRGPRSEDARAAALVRLGRHLYAQGELDGAKRCFNEAVELCPESWNYRRQAMMLDPDRIGQLNTDPAFWAAVDALGDEPYYPLADLGPAG